MAALDGHGYGNIGSGGHSGKTLKAHRVAFELAKGPIPAGLGVLHDCDTPRCCNPAHLRLGDQQANMQDMARRGRSGPKNNPSCMPRGERHGLRIHPERAARGERVGGAKLKEADVMAIRASTLSQRALARQFGVSRRTITLILQGKTWRHVRAA